MGRIIVSDNVSLDGVMQDPAGDEGFERGGWVGLIKDRPELARLALDEALGAEAMLMGRRTYEWFAGRWPSRSGALADRLNSMPKYVVSSTLVRSRLEQRDGVRGDLLSEVARLKAELSGDIVVPASSGIVRTLLEHGLVDELRLKVFPVVLGAGQRLFGETDGTNGDAARRRPDARRRHGVPHLRGSSGQWIGDTMTSHTVGTRDEWLAAREALLVREKEHTRLGDELARAATRAALGAGGEGLPLRHGGRREGHRRAVRRSLAAARLPLHVRAELRGRLPGQLVDRRHASTASCRTCTPVT